MNIGSKVICINDTIDADKIEEIKKDFENYDQDDIEALMDFITDPQNLHDTNREIKQLD